MRSGGAIWLLIGFAIASAVLLLATQVSGPHVVWARLLGLACGVSVAASVLLSAFLWVGLGAARLARRGPGA